MPVITTNLEDAHWHRGSIESIEGAGVEMLRNIASAFSPLSVGSLDGDET
jgi:hypothetical protein